jgi:hypothetical protein
MKSTVAALLLAGSAAQEVWSILDYSFDTILMGVDFSTKTNGFLPFSDNGIGNGVKLTTDGGMTWPVHGQIAPKSIMFMDSATKGQNGVMGGMFDQQYTINGGYNWTMSQHALGQSLIGQSCEGLADPQDTVFFGCIGENGMGQNGVAISTDGGRTYTFNNINELNSYARYGAFPDKNTWYIAAGQWPATEPEDSLVYEMSSRISIHNENGKLSKRLNLDRQEEATTTTSGWYGQIVKTTDAGQTWTTQFTTTDYYFNQIACYDDLHCCAVGESDSGAAPGVRIMCTQDGTTWTQSYFQAGGQYSLMAVTALSSQEYWVGGGTLQYIGFGANMLHTIDGGQTWTKDFVAKMYADDIDCVGIYNCWSTALQVNGQSGLMIYS